MQRILRCVSLIGIATVLVACATGEEKTGDSAGNAFTKVDDGQDKLRDDRDTLVSITSTDRAPRTADLRADVRAYAARAAARAGVKSPAFVEVDIATGIDKLTHVRLNQTHGNVKVWGADVVVHVSATEILGIAGTISNKVESANMRASLAPADALGRAKADRIGTRANVPVSREASETIVHVGANGPRLAYHTTFFNEVSGDLDPGLWHHVYDAQTGELLARWNDIHSLSQASGTSGNAKFHHAWHDELDVEGSGSAYTMTTTRLKTVDLAGSQSGNGAEITKPLDGFTDAAINDAHGYAEITLNMLSGWFGHDSIDDHGFQIFSRVHYGHNYENAFWDGTEMTYGDGASTFYPLSGAVDVVAHEIDHGFTAKHSGLAYSGEAGGLNEGFSDIAGKSAEFFYKSQANWDLGADIFKAEGAALRYMCNPSRDGTSIENASQMTPGLDPHYSSGVPNKFFCRLAKRFAGSVDGDATQASVRRAGQAVFEANAHYWTSSSTFVEACQGTVDAARALQYSTDEIAQIKQSWVDVGVYCDGLIPPPPNCDETLTGASGSFTSPGYPANYANNINRTWCIDAPAGQQVTLKFDDFETEGGYDYVTLRDGNAVQVSKTSGTVAPAPITSNRVYLTFSSDYTVGKKGFKASYTAQ